MGLTPVVRKLSRVIASIAASSSTSSSLADLLTTSMPISNLKLLVERIKELLSVGRVPAKTEVAVDRFESLYLALSVIDFFLGCCGGGVSLFILT